MGPTTISNEKFIDECISKFVDLLDSDSYTSDLSPQLRRRLLHLIKFNLHTVVDRQEFVKCIASVFNRFLFELIQAHYNTKQREQDFVRLINSKGCSISDPNITDAVIDLLIKLYKAAGQCADTSFERNVLIKFLLKELGEQNHVKRQVERVIQTLYKCSCFHVTKREGASGRLKLKEDLCDALDLRQKHDVELIKIAQANCIRLSPESWVHLLYRHISPENLSRMQSLLDKHQDPVSVSELQLSVIKAGDKYGVSDYIRSLQHIQDLMKATSSERDVIDIEILRDIMENLVSIKHLFIIRQGRGRIKS